MNNLNSFFEDLPNLSLHDISNHVSEEFARFTSKKITNPADPDSPARIPSPTAPVATDDDFNVGNTLNDFIARALARDQTSHHVASSAASETKSESSSNHDETPLSNETVTPYPPSEPVPPTVSNNLSNQNQTPPSQETVTTTPPPARVPPTVSNSRHYPTRLPVPSPSAPPAPALRSSTVFTLPSEPPPPYVKTSVGRSPPAYNQPAFPKHNSSIPAPTVHSKPTVQPPFFPSVSSIEQYSPQTSILTVTCRKKYCARNSTRYNRNSVP